MSISKAKYAAGFVTENVVRCWLDPTVVVWSLVMVFWAPLGLLHRARRAAFRAKREEFVSERWSKHIQTPDLTAKLLKKPGSHVVLVGASFGEVLIVDKITKALRGTRPEIKVTWAIRDKHTVEHVKKMHPGQSVVYWPFDWIYPVVKWLKAVKPDVIVMLERYRFPIFVRASNAYGADVVLVNGRCRQRKFFFVFGKPYYKWLFSGFRAVFFQNENYMHNAVPLLNPRTKAEATGDIKFDLSHIPIDAEKAVAVDRWLGTAGDVPVLAVGSTDGAEEERFVLEAFQAVRKSVDVRLMIAPRRPGRADELAEICRSFGFTVSRRSKMDGPADVYILDSFGELSYAYKFASAAYVGGALFGMGHNVIEPLEWGIPVSYGSNRGHFGTIQESCERAGVGTRIAKSSQLAVHWLGVLNSSECRAEIADQCRTMLERHRGALGVTLDEVHELIDERESRPR
jgi:3-deoxy-D-manno-octulosonic-acid transferase